MNPPPGREPPAVPAVGCHARHRRRSFACRAGDSQALATILTEARRARPDDHALHRRIAHYQKLAAPPPLRALRDVPAESRTVSLSEVRLEAASTGWGAALRNQVLPEGDGSGLLAVGGRFFESGFYAHAPARHAVRLDQGWKTFSTGYGLQDRHAGSVVFVLKGDGRELFRSARVSDHRPRECEVSVAGVSLLELLVEDAGDGRDNDWGLWLDPRLRR